MRCTYEKTIFENTDNGYCVVEYTSNDSSIPFGARNKHGKSSEIHFTATGYRLPVTKTIDVELDGKWETNKFGMQYTVEHYVELIPHTKAGIIGYLSSGLIKGIGDKTAKLIVTRFGLNTLEIMDKMPDRLAEVKGISNKKLETIKKSYVENRAIRDIVTYLSPFGISVKKALKIHKEFGAHSMSILRNQPFELCSLKGFGFKTVDAIARKSACSLNDPMRIRGALCFSLDESMMSGHLFLDKLFLRNHAFMLLNDGYQNTVVTKQEVNEELYSMIKNTILIAENGNVYKPENLFAEHDTAKRIVQLLAERNKAVDIESELLKAQKDLNLALSSKQADAVRNCFNFNLSIITGGPGTGKTTILKVVLEIYKHLVNGKILLAAPTGRSARRIVESTGYPYASTLHSALGLMSDDFGNTSDPLDADLIIVDEFSMVDMRLAKQFFCRIKNGIKVLIVGDADQLPSVGAGNVFREMISSGRIPITTLDVVYRQSDTSSIALNAHSINKGILKMQYDEDFMFEQTATEQDAAQSIEKLYVSEIAEHGIQNVQVLSPFRNRGDTCVNALNEEIRKLVNPHQANVPELKVGNRIYRLNDRVMQNKNKNEISNGDIGIITSVYDGDDNDSSVTITFSDHREVEYAPEDLDIIELAYATTIHKSQGSEYHTVIIPMLRKFYIMLKRNLIYTAITRAKKKVVLVGEKQALFMAIRKNDTDKRNTMLADRICRSYEALQSKKKNEPVLEQIQISN